MPLRFYQDQCLRALNSNLEHGIAKLLAVLATGCGKTIIAAHIPRWFPGRQTVFLIHTEELARQAQEKIQAWNPGLNVGIEMGTLYAPVDADVVVASVQTLGRSGGRRIESFDPNRLGALIIDEAHHATAEGYENVLRYFGLYGLGDTHGRLLLGITATPDRSDGVGLARIFDKVAFNYDLISAIRDGWLVNLKGVRVRTMVNLDSVSTTAGDFQQDELSAAVNTVARNKLVVEEWLKNAERRKTLGFTVDIQHAKDLADAFRAQDVPAVAVWGVDPDRDRKMRASYDSADGVTLNANMLTEGYDDPRIACILNTAPTKSRSRYAQRVGRGTRIPEDIDNLNDARDMGLEISKEECLVLDFTDTSSRHSLATLPSLFGLPKDLDLKGRFVTEAIAAIDEVRQLSPETDLSGLEELDNLKSYVEQVNLFTVRYAPEVMENSKYQWHRSSTGDYMLLLPRRERVTISEDLLGQYKIRGVVNGSEFEDTERNLSDAFGTADSMLRYLGRNLMQYVRRENPSQRMKGPATDRQKQAISFQCWKRKQAVPDLSKMTKHEASALLQKFEIA